MMSNEEILKRVMACLGLEEISIEDVEAIKYNSKDYELHWYRDMEK